MPGTDDNTAYGAKLSGKVDTFSWQVAYSCADDGTLNIANLASRAKKHLSDLHHGIHVNKLLQADFKSPSQFEFNVLTVSQNQNEALRAEARTIQEYLAAGKLLYNKTIDGRGHVSFP